MKWTIEYYEQVDTTQPAEVFEDALRRDHRALLVKFRAVMIELTVHGNLLGGGFIEPCHDFKGLWEIRVIAHKWLGRELFGFDKQRVVLLHGYVKRTGESASQKDLRKAFNYWQEYLKTCRVSPVK